MIHTTDPCCVKKYYNFDLFEINFIKKNFEITKTLYFFNNIEYLEKKKFKK
jgi:hypothetical protein